MIVLYSQELTLSARHFGIEEGLSHRRVNAIHQDQQGFIWAGTAYGLNRFDGYAFKWWTREKNGLKGNAIHAITEDSKGRLWAVQNRVTQGKPFFYIRHLNILDPENEKILPLEAALGAPFPVPFKEVYANFQVTGADGSIYMGTSGQARLIRYHADSGFEVDTIPGYSSFFPLEQTTDGHFWGISDLHQLLKIDETGRVIREVRFDQSLKPQKVAFDGTYLWVQTGGEHTPPVFHKVTAATGEAEQVGAGALRLPEHLHRTGYHQIRYDPHNAWIWGISTFPHLSAFRPGQTEEVEKLTEALTQAVASGIRSPRAFLVDGAGNIWLGGEFGLSVFRIKPQRFDQLFHKAHFESQKDGMAFRGIARVGEQLVAVAEASGLKLLNLKTGAKQPIQLPDSVRSRGVSNGFALWVDRENQFLWTLGNTVYRVRLKPELDFEPIGRQKREMVVWALYKDQMGRLWLGTEGGLSYLDPGEDQIWYWAPNRGYEAIDGARVLNFSPAEDGRFWACTNNGLFEVEPGLGITNYYHTRGAEGYTLPHDNIRFVHRDTSGIYWLASGGGGLIRWDRPAGTWAQFTRADGLPNNNLYAIYEDDNEQLWLSSDLGIMQFDKNTHRIQTYQEEDGITHNEFNRASHFKDTLSGRIYFGGLNGITTFDPATFYSADTVQTAPLVITGFQQFDGAQNRLVDRKGQLAQEGQIVLRPKDRFFNLSFALLTYYQPEEIRYAYQIEGWHTDWQYQRERNLRLGRLPYGRHLLRIKAQAANGQWSKKELQIPVVVLRPFYLKAWFIALLLLAVAGSIFRLNRFNLKRQLERQEAKQLKELDRVKTHFFTNITHEFRTPLTVIMGMAERISGHDTERRLIARNSNNLLRLVNQLLDLVKMESGNLPLELKQGDIIAFLQYVSESFQAQATRKNIKLAVAHAQQPVIMDFDEKALQQILYNLLSNAVKFTPVGGGITLRTQALPPEAPEWFSIEVADDGIGISQHQLPHIFNRFFQADSSSTRGREGTGIGLSLAKDLVTLMGGSITAKSQLGAGTRFTVQLPLRRNAGTPKLALPGAAQSSKPLPAPTSLTEGAAPKPERSHEKPLLMIVEDNEDVALYLEQTLAHAYHTLIAPDGQEGVEMALERIPDIVITDVMMPKMDGFELCATLKADERTCHIPIIMLTAKAMEEDRIAGLKTGADAYLMKPFQKEELLVRLDKLTELRRSLQQFYQARWPLPAATASHSPISKSTLDEQFLQKISQIIEEKIGDANLDIDYLCKAGHLSATQLHRKMKALTGDSPIRYIRKLRLHRAKSTLETTKLPVAEVAYQFGFTDPNYFSRVFNKEFGHPPSSIRGN